MIPGLGYIPFLDPLPVDPYWLVLMLPLVVLVSVVYKALRLDDLSRLPQSAAWMSLQIVAFMMLAAAVVWLMVEFVG